MCKQSLRDIRFDLGFKVFRTKNIRENPCGKASTGHVRLNLYTYFPYVFYIHKKNYHHSRVYNVGH